MKGEKKRGKYKTKESIHHSKLAINISYQKKENRRKGNDNLMHKSVFFL